MKETQYIVWLENPDTKGTWIPYEAKDTKEALNIITKLNYSNQLFKITSNYKEIDLSVI